MIQVFLKSIITFTNLHLTDNLKKARANLKGKIGIYTIVCLVTGAIYFGSSIDLAERLYDHFVEFKTNTHLYRAITLYGLDKFSFNIVEFVTDHLKLLACEQKWLDILFTIMPGALIFNFVSKAASILGYKHTEAAIAKIKARFIDPFNHPIFGITHSFETRLLISKPGEINPMFGKTHSAESRALISFKLSTPVTLYDHNNVYVLTFKNSVELSKFLGCHKTTVGRYIKSGKLYNGLYYIRKDHSKES